MGQSLDQSEYPGETDRPYPPRYRWFKWVVALLILQVVSGIGLQYGWTRYADRRLQAEIDAIHARGEPILVQDFQVNTNLPDADNAAWYYHQAEAAIQKPDDVAVTRFDETHQASPQDIAAADAVVRREAPALHWIDLASQHPRVAWNVRVIHPFINTPLPHLNWARTMANLLATDAVSAHARGDDAQAVADVRNLHRLADAMQQYFPTIVSRLVGVGIDALGSDRARRLACDLSIAAGSATTRPDAATPQQVIDLIAELSDEKQYVLAGRRCMIGEKALMLDATASFFPSAGRLAPAFCFCAIRMLDIDEQVAQAMNEPDYPHVMAKISNPFKPDPVFGPIDSLAHFSILSGILTPSLSRWCIMHFRGLTDRRAAVLALAIRFYRFDHHGHWPRSLDELTPKYLPAIPKDPFSPNASPFRYKPDAAGGPIIYSVGEDGIDDGGSEQPISKNLIPDTWNGKDAVYHLTLLPPTTQPADSP
jgi:hypothetical protein